MKKMRFILMLVLLFSLAALYACGGNGSDESASTNDNEATETTEEATNDSDSTSSSGETYEFKITYVTQTEHNWHQVAEKLKEELAERSDGRMELELYPAAQLGPEPDMVQQMSNGTLDFALLTVPYLSTRIPEFEAWNLPFLFETLEDGVKAIETDAAQQMLTLLEDQGIKGMGYMHTGTHSLVLKDTEINSLEDVKGKKLRFTAGAALLGYWEELGASPIAMGLPEVYNALQTGVIEGVSVDTNALLSEKYYEVSDSYLLTKHIVFGGVFGMSLANYEGMPDEDRQIVEEAVAAALEWGNEQLLINDKEDLEEVKGLLDVAELENRDEFVEKAKEIHAEFANEYELIDQFLNEIEN